jgi:hypothetical protein
VAESDVNHEAQQACILTVYVEPVRVELLYVGEYKAGIP